jgi:excisionase family DNA binding protein
MSDEKASTGARNSPPREDGAHEARADLPAVLTVDELSAHLRLDRKTVYEAIARREIPGAVRVGRNIRIDRDAVLRWLQTGTGVSRSTRRTR